MRNSSAGAASVSDEFPETHHMAAPVRFSAWRLLSAGEPGHLADVGIAPQREPLSVNTAHSLIGGQPPRNEMSAIRSRLPDLHPWLLQQAAKEAKCQRPGLRRIR